MNIIDPSDFNTIKSLKKSTIAFPDIQFSGGQLNRKKTTIKAAFSIISNNVEKQFISELIDIWDNGGGIVWQNKILETLHEKILEMIKEYKIEKSELLLKKIFIYIQLWGGNTSRGFFLKNGGFINNFIQKTYETAVTDVLNDDPIESLTALLTLNQMGISFATKHIYFWSDKKYPIYDNIIAMLVFGRLPNNNTNHYQTYINSLKALSIQKNIESSIIERSLFNWYETKEGNIWFCIRKN